MKEISKWEVVWSNDKPLIVFRDYGVFKIFKTKVERMIQVKSDKIGKALPGEALAILALIQEAVFNTLGSLYD